MTLSFLLTSLIVVASPGTGVLYTLAVALTQGARPSIAAAFGCTLGIVPQMLAAKPGLAASIDRKSTRLNSSHTVISYAVFCLEKKTKTFRLDCLMTDAADAMVH